MDPSEIQRRLMRLLTEEMSLQIPSPDTDLIREGYLDSMTFVDLLQRVEARFGIWIQFDEIDLSEFRSIRQMASFIERQQSSESPAAPAGRLDREPNP